MLLALETYLTDSKVPNAETRTLIEKNDWKTTDDNGFERLLKEDLWRDLAFRSFIWIAFAVVAQLYAVSTGKISAIDYLAKLLGNLVPIVNVIGSAALAICSIALWIKDSEAVATTEESRSKFGGKLAGTIRRVGGDLTLWTLGGITGAMAAIWTTLFLVMPGWREWALSAMFTLVMVLLVIGTGFMNRLVRRGRPTLLAYTWPTPTRIHQIYGVAVIFFFALWFGMPTLNEKISSLF